MIWILEGDRCVWRGDPSWDPYFGETVVLTAGTFLNGLIHIGMGTLSWRSLR